ncbi:MAG: hypothetical protein AB7F96_07770 [Beijerinckiaceae bacterium]
MPRYPGKGRISYRGVMALVIGLMFVWFALQPEYFDNHAPPFAILAVMFVAGAALVYGGIASLRFVWKRSELVRTGVRSPAEICVLADDDTDRGSETVHVRVNGRCQALGVDRSGAVAKFNDGKVRSGEVWLDENGAVHAIAISGEHFNTLIGGREIPAGTFGKSD